MGIYIILYTLLLFSIIFDGERASLSSKKRVLYLWVIVFTLFRGLRWATGTDWEQYLYVFQTSDWNNIFNYDRGFGTMEPGYIFINTFIRSLGFNYTFFLLLTNFFILISYVKFSLSNSAKPIYVFVLIMFSTQFFPVREGIAVAFIMLGMCNFSDKRYLRVLICTIFAFLIHRSALVFLPVYLLIFFKRIPTKWAVIIATVGLILVQIGKINSILISLVGGITFLGGGEVGDKFQHYIGFNQSERGEITAISGSINSVIFILTLIPFGVMADSLFGKLKSKINYAFIYNVYFAFVMIGIIFSTNELSNLRRMQNHLMFSFPILFATYILYLRRKYPTYSFFFTTVFILYAMFRSYTLFFGGYPDALFPYYSVFDNIRHR